MDENNVPTEQDDWMPPELVERARLAAERDAGSLEKREAKRAKEEKRRQRGIGLRYPPAGRHRGLSAAFGVLSLLALLAGALLSFVGPFAAAELENEGPQGRLLGLLSLAALFALLLVMLLPVPKRAYRPALLALLGAALPLHLAQGMATALHRYPEGTATMQAIPNAILGAAVVTLLSALPWLLLGAARRRNTEKLAALFLGIALSISLFGILAQLLPARPGQPAPDPVRPVQQINVLQNLFFLLLIVTWPVLSRPVLSNLVPEKKNLGENEE